MRILITNDDGIGAPGLTVLEQIAAELSNDVWVVAPEADCSDAFGAPTVYQPLKLHRFGRRRYSLAGTPADCVLVGIKHILRGRRPSLLLAGVNALQSTLLEVPSISLSLITGGHKTEVKWDTPKSHGPELLRMLMQREWPDDVLLNLNFPDCKPAEVKGVAFTKQGRRPSRIWSVRLSDSECSHELRIERHKSQPRRDTDLWAVATGRISVTPIKLDLTAGMSQGPDEGRFNRRQRRRTKQGRHSNAWVGGRP